MRPSRRQVKAFLEALELAERYKPFQVAKRRVYARYGLLGSRFDIITSSIMYKIYRLQGVIDKIVKEAVGIDPGRQPAFIRQALRLTVYFSLFDEVGDREFADAILSAAERIAAKRFREEDASLIRRLSQLLAGGWRPGPEIEAEMRLLLPSILVARLERLLSREEIERFAEAVNTRRPVNGLRVNTLKSSVKEVLEALRRAGVEYAEPSSRVPNHVRYRGRIDYESFEPLRAGKAVPQDEASAAAALLLSPKPGSRVVDLCAAPGGKTTHLAELMRLQGIVAALELYPDRVEHLRGLAARTGTYTAIQPLQADATRASSLLPRGGFDYVLLDPPCTSTGAIAKHPEARWRLTEKTIKRHVRLQRSLLLEAVELLRPGGRLLYTVCSVLPEEGEENIEWLLQQRRDLELVPLTGPYDPSPLLPGAMRAWPHRHGTTGFFYALLEKR